MNRLVVLDTNCLVQMLSIHSPYRSAWQAFRDGKYILCVTNEILEEYQEIICRVANEAVAHNIVNAIDVVLILVFLYLIFVFVL